MFSIIKLLVKREINQTYPTKWTILLAILQELIVLFVLYFVSKSIKFKEFLPLENMDYFSFIFVGELTLRPLALIVLSIGKNFREGISQGGLDYFLTLPYSPVKIFWLMGLSSALLEILKLIILLCIVVLFGLMKIKLVPFLLYILSQVAFFPIFLGVSTLGGILVVKFGRGDISMAKLCSLSTIFAGVYFPLNILPDYLQKLSFLSPFLLPLNLARNIIAGGEISYWIYFNIIVFGLIFLIVIKPVLEFATKHYQKGYGQKIWIN